MSEEAVQLFDEIGQTLSGNKRSSMFGVLCYKHGWKSFILFYDNEIVCKLFDEVRSLFNPTGNSKALVNWISLLYLLKER